MSEEDEIAAEVDRLMRAAVMAGAQLGERLVRARAERDRQTVAATRDAARAQQDQHTAHRDVARAVHRQVGDPQFWEKATPERIGLTFAAAYEWREHDPQAAASLTALRLGLREHHGINVDDVLRGRLEDLDDGQRRLAQQVLGQHMAPPTSSSASGAGTPADGVEVLAHALGDQDRARSDQRRADLERARVDALEHQRSAGGTGGAEQEPQLVDEVYARYTEAGREHIDHDQAAAENVPTGEHVAYRPGEAPGASPAAETARLQADQHFPTSAAQSIRLGQPAARARVLRGAHPNRERGQELGR